MTCNALPFASSLARSLLRELVAIVSSICARKRKTAIISIGSAAVLAGQDGNPTITRALTSTIPVADMLRRPGTQGSRTFPVWLGSMSLLQTNANPGIAPDMTEAEIPPSKLSADGVIETDIPSRLDCLRWSGFHTRVVTALGI